MLCCDDDDDDDVTGYCSWDVVCCPCHQLTSR